MKLLKIFFFILMGGFLIWSCNREEDKLILNDVLPSTLNDVAVKEYVFQEPPSGQNPLMVTLSWTKTEFNISSNTSHPEPAGPVSYSVQIDKQGNNFGNSVVLASTTTLLADLFLRDVNAILQTKFGADPSQSVTYEVRVVAYYGQNQAHSIPSTNVITLKITPYKPAVVAEPIYLLGDMNNWDNTNTQYLMFRNSNDINDKTYTYTGRLAANNYFKFLSKSSLGTYKAYCRKDDTTMVLQESTGGSFYNQNERYVTITINTETLTYTISDYAGSNAGTLYNTMGPIGGFCNWDNEPMMTQSTYDGHQWSSTVTFSASTVVKFRGNKNWANNWGGQDVDNPYGKAVFDGPGCTISVPGTYKIYFNDLTGHYAMIK